MMKKKAFLQSNNLISIIIYVCMIWSYGVHDKVQTYSRPNITLFLADQYPELVNELYRLWQDWVLQKNELLKP